MSWQQAVEKTVTGLGLDLVELERSAGGLLRVYIDRLEPEQFVNVDDCERVTRQLQYLLEVENVDYSRLEVSSPGLDRPLKTDAHFARFVGQDIDVTLRMALNNRKKFRGKLVPGEPEGPGSWAVVFGEAGQEQVLNFQLDEIREARLVPVIDFKGRKASQPAAADQDKKPDGELTP
jgi:ribosome maturation factor RimP